MRHKKKQEILTHTLGKKQTEIAYISDQISDLKHTDFRIAIIRNIFKEQNKPCLSVTVRAI